jgi:hypothetical protein
MFVYKVAIKIISEKEQEWFNWMSDTHIPNVLNTGHFMDFNFLKLKSNGTLLDNKFAKYVIHYFCRTEEDFKKYQSENAQILQKEHKNKYKEKVEFEATREIYQDMTSDMIIAAKKAKVLI